MTTHSWPVLGLDDWQETYATVRLWTQIIGKTRLALSPVQNHWWHVALYVSTRGLRTSPIPCGERTFEVELDFVSHMLLVQTSDGTTTTMPLMPKSVAEFYVEYLALLRSLDIELSIWPVPVEIADPIPFAEDHGHLAYDALAIHRFWRALVQVDRVFQRASERVIGKASPVHFFWGAFDLAYARFSGREAPLHSTHAGSLPNTPERVLREQYSHECARVGFWLGSGTVPEAAFYADAHPEPAGYAEAPVRPAASRYDPSLRAWLLPYAAVRTSVSPETTLLAFLDSTFAAAAAYGGWDRHALERPRSAVTLGVHPDHP